jgi:phosphoribosyl 1,2-cyclic phosphodiesterase
MKIIVTGSGGWEGTPSPFCTCRICSAAQREPHGIESRAKPGFCVQTAAGRFFLEASIDFRAQISRFHLPAASDFLISHWHFDHMYGLFDLAAWVDLRMKGDVTVYGSRETVGRVTTTIGHVSFKTRELAPFETFTLAGVQVTPIPVQHMRAQDSRDPQSTLHNVFGYVLEADGFRVAYLADYYSLPEETVEVVRGADVVIADGTYLCEEHFPKDPYHEALTNDPDHLHGDEIFRELLKLRAQKYLFFSITHLSELRHAEIQKLLPQDMHLSFDGMVISKETDYGAYPG